jgi:hypothetical protein
MGEDHPFGHGKAENFSSGVEGTLILIAAVSTQVALVRPPSRAMVTANASRLQRDPAKDR